MARLACDRGEVGISNPAAPHSRLYENRENLMNSPDPEYDNEDENEGQMSGGGYEADGTTRVGVEEL